LERATLFLIKVGFISLSFNRNSTNETFIVGLDILLSGLLHFEENNKQEYHKTEVNPEMEHLGRIHFSFAFLNTRT
jgi:hypothetical protein